jgi:hypothetical protein
MLLYDAPSLADIPGSAQAVAAPPELAEELDRRFPTAAKVLLLRPEDSYSTEPFYPGGATVLVVDGMRLTDYAVVRTWIERWRLRDPASGDPAAPLPGSLAIRIDLGWWARTRDYLVADGCAPPLWYVNAPGLGLGELAGLAVAVRDPGAVSTSYTVEGWPPPEPRRRVQPDYEAVAVAVLPFPGGRALVVFQDGRVWDDEGVEIEAPGADLDSPVIDATWTEGGYCLLTARGNLLRRKIERPVSHPSTVGG